jgi:hypothetical protein
MNKIGLDDYYNLEGHSEVEDLPTMTPKSIEELIKEATTKNYKHILPEIARVESRIDKEIFCKQLSDKLKVKVEYIRQAVTPQEEEVKAPLVEEVEAWPEEVEGCELFDDIYNVIKQHVVMGQDSVVAGTLWTVLTYCYDAFRIMPVLGVTSPEKRCGKTTLLEVLSGLTNKPILASNITPSAVFRTIEAHQPCLLIDEADTFFKDNEELRGILNCGHTRRSAFVIRTNVNTMVPEKFSVWAPKAIALIGELPGTLVDRAVSIRMQRKAPFETVKKVSLDFDKEYLHLRRKLKRWTTDYHRVIECKKLRCLSQVATEQTTTGRL